DSYGRPAVERNTVNVILNLKNAQTVFLNAHLDGGLLDPTFALRYSVAAAPSPWNLVLEAAVKVPIDGQRDFLSTGHTDVGLQATLQRFAGRHAAYLSAAAVRTQGGVLTSNDRTEIVPTYIFGYEYSYSQKTNIVAQFYVSPSPFRHEDTDLPGLLSTKYQISIGLRHRSYASVWTFAITENVRNFDNTPDIGFQIGWAYSPAFMRLSAFDLRRSISQRPAGPGGRSVRNTADIAMTSMLSGMSSSRIFTNDPLARSALITPTGMPPQPRPARRKACFAPRSASRQVFAEKTPKSFPCDSSERSVRTSCLCCASARAGIGPLSDAKGCVGDATKAIPTLSSCSLVSSAGAVGRVPITPKAQRPSITGCKTAPSAST